MYRPLMLALLALTCFIWPAGAETRHANQITGQWRQVATNAGQCATCRLTVDRTGTTFVVTASNGWKVEVRQLVGLGDAVYAGGGHWERAPPRLHPSKRLTTHFFIQDERLHMTMLLLRPDGSPWQIRATFEREIPMM